MMKITKFQLGQLQANCYILSVGGDCLVIDPADDASFILEELQRRRLKLKAMLATHGHFDHMLAAGEIQLSLKKPYYIFNEDRFLIDRVKETAGHFLGYEPAVIMPTIFEDLEPGELKLGDFDFEVMETPGHTPGSASFYFKKEGIVFTGDTLFKGSIGRTDFSYCDKKKMKKSLESLFRLPEITRVYPGHEEETTIGAEKKNSGVFFDYLK